VIDEMIRTLEYTVGFLEKSVGDLSEGEMVEQPPGVPNHGTWTLGHVTLSCQEMAAYLGAERWLPGDWESLFGYGSTPRSNGHQYPLKTEMLVLLSDAAARLIQVLWEVDATVLGQPLSDDDFPSTGHILLQVVVAHTAYHAGQLAVWRKAIGKESAAVFV
jgi:hypothetical protein